MHNRKVHFTVTDAGTLGQSPRSSAVFLSIYSYFRIEFAILTLLLKK